MPRLFTGLQLPEDVAARLAALRGGLPGARWIDPADYHVTLRFIGDVEPHVADDVLDALEASTAPPLPVDFEGLGAFGGDRPHAVIARVKLSETLADMQAEQERRLRRLGLAAELRKYAPHVTLARLNHGHAPDVAAYLALHGAKALPGFLAQSWALFSARASTGGGPYAVEATFPLR